MTLQNHSRLWYEPGGRRALLTLLRRLRGAQGRVPYGPGAPADGRDHRRIAALERRLAAEAPVLASMYAMFNHLAEGEGPIRREALPPAPPRRGRPRPVHMAVLMALAAVVALCVTLSTQLHPGGLPGCSPAADLAAAIPPPVHSGSCASYATNK